MRDDHRPDGWSQTELATLTTLAETFVHGRAADRARLACEALGRSADPGQLRQLRLVLWAMDSRLISLFLAGRPVGLRAMSAAARERYLLGWANSALPQRRSAFQAMRKLLTFLAYGGSAAGLPDPRLVAIGYRPDDPPVTSARTSIRPLALPNGSGPSDEPWTMEADVVIVGSGAGGGVMAAELTAAGRSVVVLEAGPLVDEAAMPRTEVEAFDRLYLDHGLLTTWDGSITMLAGSAVGGGTLINWMTCIPATASVRTEWETEHGLEGLTGGAWEADVHAIETDLDVAESTHIPPKDAVILRGAQALGWEAAPTRRNGSGCRDCGRCPFGCVRGTKRSGIRTHLAAAAAGGARIVAEARVTRVILDEGRAVGVEGQVVVGGVPRRFVVRAGTVVLAAGALRTPAVLQRSGLEHPGIGRNLRLHPVPVVAGRFSEPIEMWRGTMQAARSLQFVEPGPGRNGYVIEAAPGHPGLMALALPWEGTDAHAEIMADSARLSPLIAITRDGGEGRTTLTRAGRVRVDYRLDRLGIGTLRHALVSMARIARAAGATEVVAVGTPPAWHRPGGEAQSDAAAFSRFETALASFDLAPNRGSVFSAHQMGSVRMGAEPPTHPCDPWGRVRIAGGTDAVVGGLYVADGSLFPTGLGVNPMITVMVLARRVARTVLAET